MLLTPARKAANHRRKLKTLKTKIMEMSADWEDEDEFFRVRFEQLTNGFDELGKQLDEFIADKKEDCAASMPTKNRNQLSLLED